MLSHLRIRDLLVVEEATLVLAPDFNVLSGGTGAGKSVLLAALDLLAGAKGRADWIRPGADRARVEAFFQVAAPVREALASRGIETEDGQFQIQREIRHDGRGRALLDGFPVSMSQLREVGALLMERQDQHGQLALLDPGRQRELLDRAMGRPALGAAYRAALAALRDADAEAQRLRRELERARREEEVLRFQIEELRAIGPRPGELAELEQAERRLRNSARIQEALREGAQRLEGTPQSLLEQLDALRALSERLERWGEPAGDFPYAAFGEAVQDLLRRWRERAEQVAEEAGEGERLAERIGQLHALERKHARPLEEILAWGAEQEILLDSLADQDRLLAQLEARRQETAAALAAAAGALSEARREAAGTLAADWQARLRRLGMERCALRIEVAPRLDEQGEIELEGRRYRAGAHGMDEIRVRVRPNPDLPEGELREVPSGGELSRIALALHLLGVESEAPPLLVLDEVDAGLGADTAAVLAAELRGLAGKRQIVLVTHQAPLAAAAARQFCVSKDFDGARTRSTVLALEGEARVAEIARMLGGGAADEKTRLLAAAMLAASAGEKGRRKRAAG